MSKVWVKLDESKVIVKVMHKLRDANYNSSKKSLPPAASGYDQLQQTETGIVGPNNISHNDSTSPSETSTKNNTDADGDGFESAAIAAVRGYYQSRQTGRASSNNISPNDSTPPSVVTHTKSDKGDGSVLFFHDGGSESGLAAAPKTIEDNDDNGGSERDSAMSTNTQAATKPVTEDEARGCLQSAETKLVSARNTMGLNDRKTFLTRGASAKDKTKSLPAAASGYDQLQQTETGIVGPNNISHNDSTSPSGTSTKNKTDADGDGFKSAAIAAVRGYYQSRQSIRSSLEAPLDPDYYNRLVNILGKDGADEIIKDSVNEALMEAGKDIIEKILSSGRDAKASNGGKKSGSASQSVLSKKRCPSQSVLFTIRGPKRGPNQNHPMQQEQEQDEKATFNNISPNDTSIMHF